MKGVNMMKVSKTLSIIILLVFLGLIVSHLTHAPSHFYIKSKAVINLDDQTENGQGDDDERKLPISLTLLYVMCVTLLVGDTFATAMVGGIRNRTFLIPIFHQSNYIVSSSQK